MKLKALFCYAALAAASATVVQPAQATTLSFVLSGAENATFTLDSNPTPAGVALTNDSFYFTDVAGTNVGSPFTFPYLTFYAQSYGGGLSAGTDTTDSGPTNFFDAFGPQIFTGVVSAPVFSSGVFELAQIGTGFAETLTISAVSATPLPSTWLMLLSGLAGLAFFAYRGTKKGPAAFAAA